MMLRTRVLWFGVGFSVVGAAISQLIWRDLLTDRHALFSDTKQKFDALEARVLNLEPTIPHPKSDSGQEVELMITSSPRGVIGKIEYQGVPTESTQTTGVAGGRLALFQAKIHISDKEKRTK